jgi:soluble lytic murein transglycosylase
MSTKRRKRDSVKIRKYNNAKGIGRGKNKKRLLPRVILGTIISAILIGMVCFVIFIIAPNAVHDKVDDIQRIQYPKTYSEYVEKYSELYNVDENLVYGVIHTESHFNPDSESQAGAMGLMQITSECFDFLKQNIPDDSTDYDTSALFDPEINIKFGTYFLSYLLDKYDNIEKTALAAYNAGFGTVDTWLQDSACSADGKNLDVILYTETANYVVKVEKAKNKYKELY